MAVLAAVGVLWLDYARIGRETLKRKAVVAERARELQGLRQYADEVDRYVRNKEILQKQIDVINHIAGSQMRWKPELQFVERVMQLHGVQIDNVVIAGTIDLAIHSESPQRLADAAKAVQAMRIDDRQPAKDEDGQRIMEVVPLRPIFIRQPTDIHWTIRLDPEPQR